MNIYILLAFFSGIVIGANLMVVILAFKVGENNDTSD